MSEEVIEKIKNNMVAKEALMNKYATKSTDAITLRPESNDIRPVFYRDIDKIIYSLSYTRYMDKTQVFSEIDNDHISKRIVHVQMVSKIARTIGRALNLNEDLIEAIALGHDLGHVPFGHVGERILNKLSLEHNEGYFNHNVQSVRTLLSLENRGLGYNISLQTLDGIISHNGEIVSDRYEPILKTKEQFLYEYEQTYFDEEASKKMRPMTLEGCVVRISDVVGYVGRDIEDAIILGLIKKEDIPSDIVQVLGNTNHDIINTIVLDIIANSYNKPYIEMSHEVHEALNKLKTFNYENIYAKADFKALEYEKMFKYLFDVYMSDLENHNESSDIYKIYLNEMDESYLENSAARIVIDYIAGMTDVYFISRFKEYSNLAKS